MFDMTNALADATIDHPKFERQLQLEDDMRTAGIQRYRENMQKAAARGTASSTMIGTRITVSFHEQMVEAINAFVAEASSGKAGRKHSSLAYFAKLDVDSVANITARCCLDTMMQKPSLTKLAMTVAGQLENEVNSRIFESEMPKAWKKFHEKAKQENLDRRQWSHLLFPAEKLGVTLEEWPKKDMLLTGMKLVELFCDSTGLFETKLVKGDGSTMYMVQPTEATLAWVAEESSRLEVMFPVAMPMIVPPKPWTSPYSGGYWRTQSSRWTLVKTGNRAYHKELADRDMPKVYQAVDALQNTSWAINLRVYEVMQQLYKVGSEIGDIPSADPMPLPNRPAWMPEGVRVEREDMTPEQLQEFLAWKAAAHAIHQRNGRMVSKRASFLRTLQVAEKFKDEEEIYFPHQLDWRGRAYPVPLYLNPQGADVQKGLLQFAEGLPIMDEVDADWLAIHGTGCYGFDKASLEDRVQWVKDHEREILASAANPYDNRFWTEADGPWTFLAFCFEWAEFKAQGYGYLSRISVQMDGTCNGLQNFSAMLLDEIGGRAVNLVPGDKPNDIYRQVAEIVAKMVELDLYGEDEEKRLYAKGWHGNINRSVCKRPVMTLAYGAKRFGFVQQVEEDTLKPWRESRPETYPFTLTSEEGKPYDYGFKAAMYLGGLIWEAVGQVVVAARAAMDWLQQVAQVVSKENLPITWATPAGFLVQQAYRVSQLKDVETTFNRTRIRIKFDSGDEKAKAKAKIDSRKQASGISPNWVHSLDASHLMMTICAANDEGITSFSMIHDSYGTHAANAGALARILREQFVQMYSQVDVLARFKETLEQQCQIELPMLPPKGTLDLNGVLESSFFFA